MAALAVLLVPGAWVAFPSPAFAAAGTISAFAGTGVAGSSGDGGPATAAAMNQPSALAVGPDGSVYVSDEENHRIRRVAPDGTISTYAGNGSAGSGGDGGAATAAQVQQVYGLAVDPAGHLYFSQYDDDVVRRVDAVSKVVSTVAGTRAGNGGFSGDGGPATSAKLDAPVGLAVTSDGSLLIADSLNLRVRKVAPHGTITTVAGDGGWGAGGDGGVATSASFIRPFGLASDGTGAFWISDPGAERVRRVDAGGTITRVAGGGSGSDGGPATSASLSDPAGVVVGGGMLLIAEYGAHRLRKVGTDGVISTLAGTGTASTTGDGGPAQEATVNSPLAVALDADGDLLEAERYGHVVRTVAGVVPPPAPVLSSTSPGSPGTATTVHVRGSAQARTTVHLHTDSTCSTAVASGTAEALGGDGIAVTVAPDSTTTLWATATSPGGAVSACSTTAVTYTSDSTAPAAPVVTGSPPSPSAATSLTWSFTAEDQAQATCVVTRGATAVVRRTPCGSPATVDLSGEVDGGYAFSVEVRDAAGNVSPVTTSATHVLDRVPPDPPAFTSWPPSPSSDRLPEWGFTAEAGSTTECELRRSGSATPLQPYALCSSPRQYDLTGQPSDTYTVTVRAKDAAGNTGSPAESPAYVLTEPGVGVPVVTSGPGTTGSGKDLTWGFSVDDGYVVTCEVTRDGTTVAGPQSPCTGSYSHPATTDGLYRLTLTTTAGSASSDYVLDTVAPAVPTFVETPPAAGALAEVSWSFSGDGSGFECSLLSGETVLQPFAACTSPDRHVLAAEGDHVFAVRAIDAALNRSAEVRSSYRYDATTPAVPTATAVSGQAAQGSSLTVGWDLVVEPGATASCRLERDGTVVRRYATCTSPVGYVLDPVDGLHTLSVTATDAVGNRSDVGTATYRLDTVAPAAPRVARLSPGTATGSSTSPQWSFTAEADATTTCELTRDGTVVRPQAPCTSPYTADLAGEPAGVHTLSVVATDLAGNAGAAGTSTYQVLVLSAPTITAGQTSPSATRTLRWAVAPAAGTTAQCRLTGPADASLPPWSACPEEHVLPDGAVDGTYVLTARSVDAEGTAGPSSTAEHDLYTAVPAAPVFVHTPPGSGSDTLLRWEFTVPERSTPECALASGTLVRAFSACTSPFLATADQGDTGYTLSVRAVSVTGVVGEAVSSTYVLERLVVVPPPEPSASPTPSGSPSPSPSPVPTPAASAPAPSPTTAPLPAPRPAAPSPFIGPVAAAPPAPSPAPFEEPVEDVDVQPVAAGDDEPAAPAPLPDPTRSAAAPAPPADAPRPTSTPTPTDEREPNVVLAAVSARAGEVGAVFAQAGRAVLGALSPAGIGAGVQAVAGFVAGLDGGDVAHAAAVAAPRSAFPFALVLMVAAFLTMQNRIDRNDPKLALAPVLAARHLEFPPPGQVRGVE